jgi:hypothetical protein
MSHSERSLSTHQSKALTGLLEGLTVTEAALLAGVSRRQLYRWLQAEHFKSALAREEALVLQAVRLKLGSLAERACEVLEDVMDHPGVPGQNFARLAAVSVLDQLVKVREVSTLEDRMSAIEEALKVRTT